MDFISSNEALIWVEGNPDRDCRTSSEHAIQIVLVAISFVALLPELIIPPGTKNRTLTHA
jgi:hypothetical protein